MVSQQGMRILPIMAAACWAAAIGFCSCGEEDRSYVANIVDGDHTPTMRTLDVNTFISDSGYTRYYITSSLWNMYEDATEPHWTFPDTLYLEQYDRDMNVNATMRCDSATYWSVKRLWRLDGNVVMVNTAGDSFLTQQVFWDQAKREVRSDSFVHIVRSDRIIEGYGFTSNEPMTAYTVNKPTGIFPVSESGKDKAPAAAQPDTVRPEPMRQPARRRPARQTSQPSIQPVPNKSAL